MLAELMVKIGADISELEKGLSKVYRSVQDTGKKMTSLGKTISTRVTAPLVALGGVALKQAADFETLRQSMDNLNGSAKEGARNFERLKKFSAGTPFQLKELASAQNMLQGFGMEADNAFQSIKMIGDIAAITGGSIDGIGIAFGQAAAEGRLMTQDVRQLINQGVPAIKMLAETMGVAENQVLNLASQGEISFDILQQSFKDATSEGGMFADGMAKQSQTLNGLFSTLKDNISVALGEIGNELAKAMNLKELVPVIIDRIQSIVEWFKSLSQEARTSMVNIVRAIATIGPTLTAAGIAVTAFGAVLSALVSPIALVIGAITGIVLAGTYVVKNLEAIGDAISEEFRSWVVAAQNTKTLMEKAILSIASFAPGIAGQAARAMNNALKIEQGVVDENKAQFQSFGEFAKDIAGDINDIFANITGIDFSTMFTPVTQETEIARRSVEGVRVSTNKLGTDMSLFREVAVPAVKTVSHSMNGLRQASAFAMDVANSFTSSFGQGMANVVVQGEKLVDVLKNIGKLLASAVIQKALSVFLTGGLGGQGFFGATGGLFGKIFGVNDALITSGGDVIKFHPDDNILAMKDFSNLNTGGYQRVEVFGTLRGTDLFVSSSRGEKEYGR